MADFLDTPKIGLMDFVHSIQVSKTNLLGDKPTPDLLKQYDPFMVNRAVGQAYDCLEAADDINRLHHLPKDIQYHYLLTRVTAGKRYGKWAGKKHVVEDNPHLMTVARHYNVRPEVARQYLNVMTEDQLEELVFQAEGAGRKDGKRKGKKK
ncbi:hypothetical protein GR28A_00113 [Vibrio phage vB_VcorM_GR28A]|nr:hypothetical protein GR28A_00113 [Vibrio phage vB_VcorM_GR28A]